MVSINVMKSITKQLKVENEKNYVTLNNINTSMDTNVSSNLYDNFTIDFDILTKHLKKQNLLPLLGSIKILVGVNLIISITILIKLKHQFN